MSAARNACQQLVKHVSTYVNTLLDNAGNSALILACRGGMHECVAALLEARADANQRGQGGKSALISAAECGYNRAISLLLQASSLGPHTLVAEGLIH